jgi:hypothetical protein
MTDAAIPGGAGFAPDRVAAQPAAAAGSRTPVLVLIFLVSLAVPLFFHAGGLRLAPYRIVLLLMFVPLMVQWLTGRGGRIILPDMLVVGFCAWSVLSLNIVHGPVEIWEFAGIFVVETMAPYWLARMSIRNAEAFRFFVASFFVVVAALTVVAAVEGVTGRLVVNEIFRGFGSTFPNAPLEPRWGLERAQATFEHPILFGVFVSAGFGLFFYALGRRGGMFRVLGPGASFAATFFSLSMGAYISVFLQVMLIGWDKVTAFIRLQRRWRILFYLVAAAYVTVDLLSNRTPFNVFIDYLTFNSGNAYNRVLIWKYGTAEVWRHPLFGIGLNEWVRAPWMSTSMDNFWLVHAVRYGLPSLICLMAAFFVMMWRIGKAPLTSPELIDARAGLLIALGGVMLSICTVHLWNATYCFLMFLLGAGAWLIDQRDAPAAEAAAPARRADPFAAAARPAAAPRRTPAIGAETAPERPVLERGAAGRGADRAVMTAPPPAHGPVIGALHRPARARRTPFDPSSRNRPLS